MKYNVVVVEGQVSRSVEVESESSPIVEEDGSLRFLKSDGRSARYIFARSHWLSVGEVPRLK